MATTTFFIALTIISFIMAVGIGFGIQFAASEWELGPLPRAFLGAIIIFPVVTMKAIDFGVIRAIPILLLIYYLGTFQVGTRLGLAVGMQAPDDNDPPDEFFDLLNRYQ